MDLVQSADTSIKTKIDQGTQKLEDNMRIALIPSSNFKVPYFLKTTWVKFLINFVRLILLFNILIFFFNLSIYCVIFY